MANVKKGFKSSYKNKRLSSINALRKLFPTLEQLKHLLAKSKKSRNLKNKI